MATERKNFVERVAAGKGYRVNIAGEVYNRFGRTLALTSRPDDDRLQFSVGKVCKCKVHRLQAYQKFGEEIYKPGMQVRHLDGDCLNNTVENIALGTASQNMMDKPKSVRVRQAGDAGRKYNHAEIRAFIESGHTYKAAMSKFGIPSLGTISFIIRKSLHSLQTNIKPI